MTKKEKQSPEGSGTSDHAAPPPIDDFPKGNEKGGKNRPSGRKTKHAAQGRSPTSESGIDGASH